MKIIQSSLLFASITSKITELISSIGILPFCVKFMKPCRTDIKIFLALQQDVRRYADILIYGIRLKVMWEIDWLKKSFSALVHCFVSDGHFREGSLNFNFSIASIKSNYSDIFSFPNKLKFDDSNICTKLWIREQKIINNCPFDTLISLKSYVWMFNFFALLKYGQKSQIFYWLKQ